MKAAVFFWALGVIGIALLAFAVWYPSAHESKGQRITHLEQQVGELQHRVSLLETQR